MNKNITLNHLYNDFKIRLKVKDITFFHDNIIEYENHKKELKEWEVKETFKEIYNLIHCNDFLLKENIDSIYIKENLKAMNNKEFKNSKVVKYRRKDKRELRAISYNCDRVKDCFTGWANETETFETMKKVYYPQMSRKWKTITKKSFKRNKSLLT